jgi:hypothetical protein
MIILPWLVVIAVGLVVYAVFVKLAARILRYKVSWISCFLFAAIALALVLLDQVLVVDRRLALRITNSVVLLLILLGLGSWFFKARATNRSGTVLGWGGAIRLMALTFAMLIVVAFAVILPANTYLKKHLPEPLDMDMD